MARSWLVWFAFLAAANAIVVFCAFSSWGSSEGIVLAARMKLASSNTQNSVTVKIFVFFIPTFPSGVPIVKITLTSSFEFF